MAELFTLEDLAAFRRVDAYQAQDDVAARRVATGLVRQHCGWHVAPTQTEVVPVTIRDTTMAGWNFFLPTLYLTAAPIVTLPDASTPTDFMWTVGGMVSRKYAWGIEGAVLQVQITHGYPAGSYQADAVAGIAMGVAARLLGQQDFERGAALTKAEQDDLGPFSIFAIA